MSPKLPEPTSYSWMLRSASSVARVSVLYFILSRKGIKIDNKTLALLFALDIALTMIMDPKSKAIKYITAELSGAGNPLVPC